MIVPRDVVSALFTAAAAAPDSFAAERVIAPMLAGLREGLEAERIEADRPALLRTSSPRPPSPDDGIATAAGRLAARLDDLALARRFGDPGAVRRVIDLIERELRQVALAKVR